MTLLAVTVCLTVALVSCSGGNEKPAVTTTADSTTAPPTTENQIPVITTAKDAVITTVAESDVTTKLPTKPFVPSTEKVAVDGKITLTVSDVKSGLLLVINTDTPYDTDVNSIFSGDYTTTVEEANKAGFTHISSQFAAVDNNHFLRTEVLEATAAMVAAFDAVAGTNKPFRVEGYKYEFASKVDAHITGNVVNIRTFYNDQTYGLNYVNHTISYNGEMVTYDKWFEANAAQFGFVYEGLAGAENIRSGQFRYVGKVHAAGIQAAGSLETYIAAIKEGTVTSVTLGEETWALTYVKLEENENAELSAEFEVGEDATFTVSGDNQEGVIIAVKQVISTETEE